MTVEEIKEQLKKSATVYQTGGFKPTNQLGESWIGKVNWKKETEELPVDKDGNRMKPLATLFLHDVIGVIKSLADVYLCTVFISPDILDHRFNTEGYFAVRLYRSSEELVSCDWINNEIKAFPLKPTVVENDYPVWDGGGIPDDIEDEIIRLEDEEDIEYFEDICEEIHSTHKIGGYPAYIQPGGWTDDYEFVFQISSDEKAGLNIVHGGSYYFFYNSENGIWDVQYDYY